MVLYVSCKAGVPNLQAMAYYQAVVYSELGHASGWPEQARVCAAQLVQAAGQQALACMHTNPSLGQIELRTCTPVSQFFKGCVCASHVLAYCLCGPLPFPSPQLAHQATEVGHCCFKVIAKLLLFSDLLILQLLQGKARLHVEL